MAYGVPAQRPAPQQLHAMPCVFVRRDAALMTSDVAAQRLQPQPSVLVRQHAMASSYCIVSRAATRSNMQQSKIVPQQRPDVQTARRALVKRPVGPLTPVLAHPKVVETLIRGVVTGRTLHSTFACHQEAKVNFLACQDIRLGVQLMDLPEELLQEVADWLPTFSMRARLRIIRRSTGDLQWRKAAPYSVDEEMSGLALGDAGAQAVSQALQAPQNLSLKELCLGENGISDLGVEALAKALVFPGCKLRRLSLRNNSMSDRGAEILSRALASHTALEELDLWGNCLSESGKRVILAAAKCDVFLEAPAPSHQPRGSINARMRSILFDWLSQVHMGVDTSAVTESNSDPQSMLFCTYSHMDAYLAGHTASRAELQLLGVACTLIAACQVRVDATEISESLARWLSFATDGACTPEEVEAKAEQVRNALSSRLNRPTVYTFLRRYLRQTGWTEESFSLANYLLELAVLDGSFLEEFRPEALAAAAAVLSRQYLSQGVNVCHMLHWKSKLLRHAQVDLQLELAPCAAAMSRLHAAQHGSCGNGRFVSKKYEWSRLHSVAKLRPNPPCEADFFAAYLSVADA